MLKLTQRSKEMEMSASLTLNKITAQKGITIAEAASRVADLGWTPSYVQEAMTFPTDYKISKTPRDPMRQVLRSYFPMQEEKDNRVYGALDAALRGDMFRNVEPRWVEWMKLFLAIIPFPEISAARSMAMVGRLAPGEELRTGFTMQMVDELRHSTIQMNLKKWYMENYIDPAGFDITEAAFGKCYATTIGRHDEPSAAHATAKPRDSIEKFFQVEINHPSVALRNILLRLSHGVMRRPTRSEPIAVLGERWIPLPLQNLHHRLLDKAIQHGWDAKLSRPSAVRLRDFHPSHRFWFVGSVQHLLPNDRPVLLQIVAKLIDRHPVDASAAFVASHLPQCFLQVCSLTYLLHDSTRVGWAFGFMHHRERFDVFPQRLPGFTRRRR